MDQNKKSYDIIVIGGGAAGIMAAISSKKNHPEKSVLIIERSFALGRKILVSGAGRCNLTNINLKENYKNHYYCDNQLLLDSVFNQFGFNDLITFFEELGIETYVEQKNNVGKIFPITDSAKNIVAILEYEISRLGIEVLLNTEVKDIKKSDPAIEIYTNNDTFKAGKVVVSVGGMTYPALGSNGSLYSVLEKLGHTVIKPVPAAVPLVTKNKLCHLLQGTKIVAGIKSFINGQEIKADYGDILFTQYGLSGSSILNISRDISIHLNRNNGGNVVIIIDFLKNLTSIDQILKRFETYAIERALLGYLPIKLIEAILNVSGIKPNKIIKDLSVSETQILKENLTNYKIDILGTRGWNEAEFTAGGIPTSEINHETLESKRISKLFFCGEVLDVDGDIGGYNISWAFCSGGLIK